MLATTDGSYSTVTDHTRFAVMVDLSRNGLIPQRVILITESVVDARKGLRNWTDSHPRCEARLYNLETLIKTAKEQNIPLYNEDGTPFVDQEI